MALNRGTGFEGVTDNTIKRGEKEEREVKPPVMNKRKSSGVNELALAGQGRYKSMAVDEQQRVGENQKDVAFISLLTNPYKLVPRNGTMGGQTVGLILQNVSDHPIEVLKFRQKTKEVMDADYKHPTKVTVQPGEEFILTCAEAGVFVTRDEYNGFITGGPEEKHLRYTPVSGKTAEVPTTKFILIGKDRGSIADYALDIATQDELERGEVSPRFEEFRVFSVKQRAGTGVVRDKNKKLNASALAVKAFFDEILGD